MDDNEHRERRWRNVKENGASRLKKIRDLSGADTGWRHKKETPSPLPSNIPPFELPEEPVPRDEPVVSPLRNFPLPASPPEEELVPREEPIASPLRSFPLPAFPPEEELSRATGTALQEPVQLVSRMTATVFLILGLLTRALQLTLLPPFLALFVPLVYLWWSRTPKFQRSWWALFLNFPLQNLVGVVPPFFNALHRLFACYFVAFVFAHVLFELSTISSDTDQLKTALN